MLTISPLLRALVTGFGLVAAGMVSSAGCVSGVGDEEPEGRGRAPKASGGQSDDPEGDAGYAHPEGEEEGGNGGGGKASGGKASGGKASGGKASGGKASAGNASAGNGGGGASDVTGSGGSVAGSDATGTGGSVAPPPKTECEPGESEQVGTCGNCGENVRACSSEGKWGAASCTGQGVCKPGAVEEDKCGNCGEKTRTCTSACDWPASFGACNGEGACKPGDTRNDASCDGCEHVTCGTACTWGNSCKLDAGAECAYEKGTNFRCCGNDKWQFCGSSCNFFACEPCGSSCASTCN